MLLLGTLMMHIRYDITMQNITISRNPLDPKMTDKPPSNVVTNQFVTRPTALD